MAGSFGISSASTSTAPTQPPSLPTYPHTHTRSRLHFFSPFSLVGSFRWSFLSAGLGPPTQACLSSMPLAFFLADAGSLDGQIDPLPPPPSFPSFFPCSSIASPSTIFEVLAVVVDAFPSRFRTKANQAAHFYGTFFTPIPQ